MNVEAKEIEVLKEDSFMDTLNYNPEELDEEIITTIEDVLVGTFTITAYCPCISCCGKDNGITASGTKAQANYTIAADTSILPFGTEVFIDGNKYVVEDVGGGIKRNHIDMYFNTHSEALSFGRQNKKVYIKKEVTTVLKPVEFKEYMLITGELMKNKVAKSTYNEKTGEVYWRNKAGVIVVSRKKNENGLYENRVEESIYKDWKRNR